MWSVGDYFRFLQRRCGRLVPLHWLTLAAAIALWGVVLAVGFPANHAPSFTPACIAETAFMLHSFVSCGAYNSFNGVSWSISTEMVMYLGFPLIAALAAWRRDALAVIALTALLGMVWLDLRSGFSPRDSWVEEPAVLRAIPSFLFGALLYYWSDVLKRMPCPRLCLLMSTACLIAAMISGAPHLIVLLLVYLTVASTAASDVVGRVSPAVKRVAPFGQLTYSIYMWHLFFILVLLNMVGDKLLHGRPIALAALFAVCYVGIGAWSYLSFVFFETPARRQIDSLGSKKVMPAISSSLTGSAPNSHADA
jgi:peptidoglycan/LPS O-acetylase OafA/YrhL